MAKNTPVEQGSTGAVGKTKLAYFLNGTEVRIVLHQAEGKSAIGPADVVQEMVVNANDFPAEFAATDGAKTLAGYGLMKLLQDRTSQLSESVTAKFEGMVKEAERLCAVDEQGVVQWRNASTRAAGTGAGRAKKVDSFLAAAVAELKGISLPDAISAVQGLDAESVKKLAANEKVVAIVERMKAEAKPATGQMDLSDML